MDKLRALELDNIIRNIHFWIITAITLFIALVYYEWDVWFPWYWTYLMFELRQNIIGSLLLIPFVYASLIFWLRGSIIVWLLSIAIILPRVVYYAPNTSFLFRNIALSFVPLAVVIILALEMQWREKQKKIMTEREKERQVYMSQIFKAQEDERRRIAQELHDDTTQELLAIANRTQTLVSSCDRYSSKEIKEHAEWVRDSVLHVSEDLRRLSLDLRPSILDDVGLVSALRWLSDRLNKEAGINARVIVKGTQRKLHSEVEVTIFRIVQEALNNTWRHSKATEVVVTLVFGADSLEVTVSDNGLGFSLEDTINKLAAEGKLGLIGMQQRARSLNGDCVIKSQIGKGTSISIEVEDKNA